MSEFFLVPSSLPFLLSPFNQIFLFIIFGWKYLIFKRTTTIGVITDPFSLSLY